MSTNTSVSRKKVLFSSYELADSSWKRFLGIMFRKKLGKPLLFILPQESITRATIHSLFCIPFDAVFLDSPKRVVAVLHSVAPWQFWVAPKAPAKYLIELPAGSARKLGIKEGEKLDF